MTRTGNWPDKLWIHSDCHLNSMSQCGDIMEVERCRNDAKLGFDKVVDFSMLHSNLGRTMDNQQVWPLTTTFFSHFFVKKKSLICLEGKSMTPQRGNTFLLHYSQELPRLRLGPLKGFLSSHSALQGPSTRLVRCFRNYRDTRTPSGVPR